ncbi:hypothetical protein GGI12_004718 [Dipsacomyces acuminosporus]|nr:hypothetical protein GGI12_004718 [Dipsacomyces acuminosporus]
MSYTSSASSSNQHLANGSGPFPCLPPSPTGLLPESARFLASTNLDSDEVVPVVPKSISTTSTNTIATTLAFSGRPSHINFEGSWLDLESDDEGDGILRSKRKNSASSKGSTGSSGRATLANIKELTRRSSMHFRKLTNKMAGH